RPPAAQTDIWENEQAPPAPAARRRTGSQPVRPRARMWFHPFPSLIHAFPFLLMLLTPTPTREKKVPRQNRIDATNIPPKDVHRRFGAVSSHHRTRGEKNWRISI